MTEIHIIRREYASGHVSYLLPYGNWSNRPYAWNSLDEALTAAQISTFRQDVEIVTFRKAEVRRFDEHGQCRLVSEDQFLRLPADQDDTSIMPGL